MTKRNFKVHIGRKGWRYFETLDAAAKFCSEVFDLCGVVLSIQYGTK